MKAIAHIDRAFGRSLVRQNDRAARQADEKLRLEAAAWFARLRGPDAGRHRDAFEAVAKRRSRGAPGGL